MQFILDYIKRHDLKPGDRLPTERELVTMTGLSLMTVRRALSELAQRGVIRREQGRGTFVQSTRIATEPLRPGSLKATLSSDQTLRTRILSTVSRPAEEREAERLALRPRSPVWEIVRVRYIADRPVIRETSVIPLLYAPDLADHLAGADSLYELLASRYGLRASSEQQELIARPPTPVERADLRLPHGQWVVEVSGVAFNHRHVPFDSFVSVFVATAFIFRFAESSAEVLTLVTAGEASAGS